MQSYKPNIHYICIFLYLPLMIIIPCFLFAQMPFQKWYGGPESDAGLSVIQTTDGDYLISGHTFSFGADSGDVWLLKTDVNGDTIWTKTYGGSRSEEGTSIIQTIDNGYIIAGYTSSYDTLGDILLIKTDSAGNTIWSKHYGGILYDCGSSVVQTMNGGFIIAGQTQSYGAGSSDVYLIKTDSIGDTLWTRTYGGTGFDRGEDVIETSDGNYLTVGTTGSYGSGGDVYLIKTDTLGNTIWTMNYGGIGYDNGSAICQTPDGGYAIAGYSNIDTVSEVDFYLIKIDSMGDTIWTKSYGRNRFDFALSMAKTFDYGYVITGYTCPENWIPLADVYVIKTDINGDTIWTRTFGGASGDLGNSVIQTDDSCYIVAGGTSSYGVGGGDVYLIKIDNNGNGEVFDLNINSLKSHARLYAIPNPFITNARIPEQENDNFSLLDITGRMMGKYKGAKIGEDLSTGVYFIVSQNKSIRPLRIVKIK